MHFNPFKMNQLRLCWPLR